MKKLAIYLLLSTYSLTFVSCMCSKTDSKRVAMEENKTKVDPKMKGDAYFAVCAAEGMLMEIKLSQLAQTNSTSAKVKQFASTMMDDNSPANSSLKRIAEEKKIFLPTQLSDKSQKVYESLEKKTGESFDKAYMNCMVGDHKHDIWRFEREAKKGKDADIKKWAADEIPGLKKHLDMAKSTCEEVKKKN